MDSGIREQGHKKVKYINMHLIGGYNTVSTNTALRGIYILAKKSLGQIENIHIIDNSTLIFDIRNSDNKIPTIAGIYAHRQMRTINCTLRKLTTSLKQEQTHRTSKCLLATSTPHLTIKEIGLGMVTLEIPTKI